MQEGEFLPTFEIQWYLSGDDGSSLSEAESSSLFLVLGTVSDIEWELWNY